MRVRRLARARWILMVWALAALATPAVLAQSPVVVEDARGRVFEWSSPPQRIIALSPSVTENLFAVGAGPQVVGVSAYSDYPPEAAGLPVVSDAVQVNLERLLSLEPDLVVADLQVVQAHAERLEALGIPVFAVNIPNLEALFDTLLLLGRVTGHEPAARDLVAALRARVAAVLERTRAIAEEQRPLVFVEVWHDPLMTAGPGSFIDELVTLAGGRNLAHDAPQPWPTYSVETVLARNPDVILLTNRYRDEVLARPAWQGVRAIQTGRVYEVEPDWLTITGPRLVDGLETLAGLFHPVE
ncbi:MAG TPA: cobalamin-binding protein [Limnochorda sp.]